MTGPLESRMADPQAGRPQTEQRGDRTVVPTQRARQGVTGQNVRYVLGFGLAGIVIAFVAIYVIYFA